MSESQAIHNESARKYFFVLPNIYDDAELSPNEFRLLAHYVRRGRCFESVRKTAECCRMSKTTVIKARQSLHEQGLIQVGTSEHGTLSVSVVDVWDKNLGLYQYSTTPSKVYQNDTAGVPDQYRTVPDQYRTVPDQYRTVPDQGNKEEPVKKNQEETGSAPAERRTMKLPDGFGGLSKDPVLDAIAGARRQAELPDVDFLREHLRPLGEAFALAAGPDHWPIKADHSVWRKTLAEWHERGFTPDRITRAVSHSRDSQLTIGGPHSVTRIAKDQPWSGSPHIQVDPDQPWLNADGTVNYTTLREHEEANDVTTMSQKRETDIDTDTEEDTEEEGSSPPVSPAIELLEHWKVCFPEKPQPRPDTKAIQAKVRSRWKSEHFREHWREAMTRASQSSTLHKDSWFDFRFFVRNDDNYQKCLDRWMSWKDDQASKNGTAATTRINYTGLGESDE